MSKCQDAIWVEDFAAECSLLWSGMKAGGEFMQRGLLLFQTHGHMDPTVVAQVESDRWHAERLIGEWGEATMHPRGTFRGDDRELPAV
jgi:hypothetical protein